MSGIRIERITKVSIHGSTTTCVAYLGPRFILARDNEQEALKQAEAMLAEEALSSRPGGRAYRATNN